MPFQGFREGPVRGEGIFDDEGAVYAVYYLNDLADLSCLESDEDKKRKGTSEHHIYSLYAPGCASVVAAEKVRKHLDSGVLHRLAKKMVANYFNPLSVDDYTCKGFVPVILGACAMSLGCRTLLDAPGYKLFFKTYYEFLCGIFETTLMMDGAVIQMKKALYGPDAFKSGTRIDFATYGRSKESPNAKPYTNGLPRQMLGGMPVGYVTQYKPQATIVASMIGPCYKQDLGYDRDDECGGCQKKLSNDLMCSRCKDQKYCSKECQRKDFGRHKAVCRTPEDVKMIKSGGSMWVNHFNMTSPGNGIGGPVGGLGQLFSMMGMGRPD